LQSRQFTLPQPTDIDTVITSLAIDLFEHAWDHQTRVRLLGVGVSGLEARAHQLSFLDQDETKQRHLLEALDALRARFGQNAVRRADSLVPKKKK
jgi:DNA polymerase-4